MNRNISIWLTSQPPIRVFLVSPFSYVKFSLPLRVNSPLLRYVVLLLSNPLFLIYLIWLGLKALVYFSFLNYNGGTITLSYSMALFGGILVDLRLLNYFLLRIILDCFLSYFILSINSLMVLFLS